MLSFRRFGHRVKLAPDALPSVLMVMVPPRLVEMMVVEVLVEPALLVRIAAEEHVSALPAVLEDNVEMMVAAEPHVDLVHPPKLALTDYVLELPQLTALEDSVETTELEETVEVAQQDKDAVPDFVNATTTVTRETVEQQSKLMEPILDCAHKDLVEPVPMGLLVQPMEDAQLKHHVTSL